MSKKPKPTDLVEITILITSRQMDDLELMARSGYYAVDVEAVADDLLSAAIRGEQGFLDRIRDE